MTILFLLLSASLYAAANSTDMMEKSFVRDNTICKVGSSKVEFSIRGLNKFTESKDKGYGELVFITQNQNKKLFDISQGLTGLFRFFKGESTLCTKSAAYNLDQETFALLFQKANRPLKDKLVIQLIDSKTLKPTKLISTDYLANKTLEAPGGFYFRTNGERLEVDMGSIERDGKKYTYQDRDFQLWMLFEKAGFSLSEKMTYQQSPFKKHFIDEADFLQATGWSAEEKKFNNSIFYLAVNHQLKRQCIIVVPTLQKFSGKEDGWRCQPITKSK